MRTLYQILVPQKSLNLFSLFIKFSVFLCFFPRLYLNSSGEDHRYDCLVSPTGWFVANCAKMWQKCVVNITSLCIFYLFMHYFTQSINILRMITPKIFLILISKLLISNFHIFEPMKILMLQMKPV